MTGGTAKISGNVTTAVLNTLTLNGGKLAVSGTLDNSGALLTLTRPLELSGTLRGGTVTASPGGSLVAKNGKLDGVSPGGSGGAAGKKMGCFGCAVTPRTDAAAYLSYAPARQNVLHHHGIGLDRRFSGDGAR